MQAACKDGPNLNRSIAVHFETLVGGFYAEPADEMLMRSVKQKELKKKVGHFYSGPTDVRSFFKKN